VLDLNWEGKWGIAVALSTIYLNLILEEVVALRVSLPLPAQPRKNQPRTANREPPNRQTAKLGSSSFSHKPLTQATTDGYAANAGGGAVTGRDRDRKSPSSGFGGLELRSRDRDRDRDKRKTRPIPNAPRRRRLMKQPKSHCGHFLLAPTAQHSPTTPKPKASTAIPDTAAEQQTADQY
jgi:hypothetical protein